MKGFLELVAFQIIFFYIIRDKISYEENAAGGAVG
jgi:hypothetical protein